MDKIVNKPIKIDLHIHSIFSKHKEKDKTLLNNCSIENVPMLIEKIKQNNIDLFSITDHDYFSYELYAKLKSRENVDFRKVLPGVEFTVSMKSDSGQLKPIHIITIFDDEDDEKVKNILNCIPHVSLKPKYGELPNSFTEEEFLKILKDINIDVVLIAHQKGSITSSTHPQRNDASSLGETKFNELLNLEYFESFEYKNLKNGIFNNLYAAKRNEEYEIIRFITGSDCHDWSVYPKHDANENDNNNFRFTYLKCLPNFKGLALSFTDSSRIKTGTNFFNTSNKNIDFIKLEINKKEVDIPLSRGINAIIGDNSIGKSLLMNWLLDRENIDSTTKEGYNAFLKQNNITIKTFVSKDDIYGFDKQGKIREQFKRNQQDELTFLKNKFPIDPNYDSQLITIQGILNEYYDNIENKFLYDDEFKSLPNIFLSNSFPTSSNLIVRKLRKFSTNEINNNQKRINLLTKVLANLNNEKNIDLFTKDEKNILISFKESLLIIKEKYENNKKAEMLKQEIWNKINFGIQLFNEKALALKSESEEKIETFNNNVDLLSEAISKLLIYKQKINTFLFDKIEDIKIEPNSLNFNKYIFVKRAKNCRKFSKQYLKSLIERALLKDKEINLATVTKDELYENVRKNMIKSSSMPENDGLSILQENIKFLLERDFEITPAIINQTHNVDVYESYSNGMNATIYFDIISNDDKIGIYAIDQPEDDVSQQSIKSHLIKNFKKMSSKRQILLVTHNPQFVVNLDADNVICFEKNNGLIEITSGALEYADMLKKVANNLDGGIESIKKRWKKYDKKQNN